MVNDKKIEEIVILELFRDLYEDFPKGLLNATESPDFILSLAPRRKIGIELTRLDQTSADPFSMENISACLSLKDEKLVLYRKKKLQEYWLILFIRNPREKPRYNMNNKLMKWKFTSGFSRVFLFSVSEGRIFELNIS